MRPSVLKKVGTTGVELPATAGRRTRAISALTVYKTCPTSPTKNRRFHPERFYVCISNTAYNNVFIRFCKIHKSV